MTSCAVLRHYVFVTCAVFCTLPFTSSQKSDLAIPDLTAYSGKVFSLSFTGHPFYGDRNLHLQIVVTSDTEPAMPLPSWLFFNSSSRALGGVPMATDCGRSLLLVRASRCPQRQPIADSNSFSDSSPHCPGLFSEVFQLTVTSGTWEDTQLAEKPKPLVFSPWALEKTRPLFTVGEKVSSNDHGCDSDRVMASLILCADVQEVIPAERMHLMTRLAEFLSIPLATLTLEPSSSMELKAVERGFQLVSAGPGTGATLCHLVQNVEILWRLSCATVKHLSDFVTVLQHNVDGGRLQEELGTGLVGWYVASSNSLLTRKNRKRRRARGGALYHTVVPTPSLQPPQPTHVLTESSTTSVVFTTSPLSRASLTESSPSLTISSSSTSSSSSSSSSVCTSSLCPSSSSSPFKSRSIQFPSPTVASLHQSSSSSSSSSLSSSSSHSSLLSSAESSLFISAGTTVTQTLPVQSTSTAPHSSSEAPSTPASALRHSLSHTAHTDLAPPTTLRLATGTVDTPPSHPSLAMESDTMTSPGHTLTSTLIRDSALHTASLSLSPTPLESSTSSLLSSSLVESLTRAVIAPTRTAQAQLEASSYKVRFPSSVDVSPPASASALNTFTRPTPPSRGAHASSTHVQDSLHTPSHRTDLFTPTHVSSVRTFMASDRPLTPPSDTVAPSLTTHTLKLTVSTSSTTILGTTPSVLSPSMSVFSSSSSASPSAVSSLPPTPPALPPKSSLSSSSLSLSSPLSLSPYSIDSSSSSHSSPAPGSPPVSLSPGEVLHPSRGIESPSVSPSIMFPSVTEAAGHVQQVSTHCPGNQPCSKTIPVSSEQEIHSSDEGFISSESSATTPTVASSSFDLHPGSSTGHAPSTAGAAEVLRSSRLSTTVLPSATTLTPSASLLLPPTTPSVVLSSASTARTSMSSSSIRAETTSLATTSGTTAATTSTTTTTTQSTTRPPPPQATTPPRRSSETVTTGWRQYWSTEWERTHVEANNRPFVENAINLIIGHQGRMLEFNIPRDVFYDVEDGDTRSLSLSLELPGGQQLPTNFWLYLEPLSQVMMGLPLHEDMDIKNISVVLVARDSQGMTATDNIALHINDAPRRYFTHRFIMRFAIDFQEFMRNRRNIVRLLDRIGTYFNDTGAHFITVMDVRQGSFLLSWTNNTLTGQVCQHQMIMYLLSRMVRRDGTVRSSFNRHIGRHLQLTEVLYERRGSCFEPPTTTAPPLTTQLTSDTKDSNRNNGLSIWAHVILPVMIAVLVFILIILILIFCNRRRRQRHVLVNAEKEVISNERNPIIFPDELESDDPSLKAKNPLVLPSDSQPSDLNQLSGQQPRVKNTNRHRDQERNRPNSEETREPPWLPREQQHQQQQQRQRRREEERDRSREPRRHSKDSNRKSKDRLSGLSAASSTLSADRPNNHYLDEDEPGSKNSTLNSTTSRGSEKKQRHPKHPPPYWQSQSDPPPYRLPPPYLTNISTGTTQV